MLAVIVVSVLAGSSSLAQIVNYVPYPVIAGFLAATGWLLFKGSFGSDRMLADRG